MIAYLKGNILSLAFDTCIIEVNGVGYEVTLTGSAASSLSGKKVGEVYTYLHVKEDGIALYGFSSLEEKNLFLKLISVQGVGPKMGIGILSQMSSSDVVKAVGTGDIKRLSTVKGLGRKTAERIVLELKDKMSIGVTDAGEDAPIVTTAGDDDAIAGLMNLGFTRAEATVGVQKAKKSGANGVEEIIMFALRSM